MDGIFKKYIFFKYLYCALYFKSAQSIKVYLKYFIDYF